MSRSVEVNTREFEFEHGKRPSGYGHWAFFGVDGSVIWVEGKYGDAKKEAQRIAKAKGHVEIKVGA